MSSTELTESDSVIIGHVKDDFKEVMDIDEPLPDWVDKQFAKFRDSYHRLIQVEPSYLLSDFNGDSTEDVVVFVNRFSDDKRGLLYLFKNGDYKIIGAGKSLENSSIRHLQCRINILGFSIRLYNFVYGLCICC